MGPAPPAVQPVGEQCPGTPPSSSQVVLLGLRAPAVPPAPCGGSPTFFSAPSLSAPAVSAESVCHECSSSSTRRLSSGTRAEAFPTKLAPSYGAGPPAAGCHLPVLARVTSGGDWSRSSLPGACSRQLRPPNLATYCQLLCWSHSWPSCRQVSCCQLQCWSSSVVSHQFRDRQRSRFQPSSSSQLRDVVKKGGSTRSKASENPKFPVFWARVPQASPRSGRGCSTQSLRPWPRQRGVLLHSWCCLSSLRHARAFLQCFPGGHQGDEKARLTFHERELAGCPIRCFSELMSNRLSKKQFQAILRHFCHACH